MKTEQTSPAANEPAVQPQDRSEWYTPNWVTALLQRLSDKDAQPLSPEEHKFMSDMVVKLSTDDFKPATKDFFGYQPQTLSFDDISQMVLALKHYFQLL